MKILLYSLLPVALLLTAGCASDESTDTATVQQAIERHLSTRTGLNMDKMRIVVDRVQHDGDQATAEVSISARDDSAAKMQMVYQLRRAGVGWEVEPKPAAAGSDPHGGAIAPAAGGRDPAGGSTAPPQGGGDLPQGHPPVGGSAGASGSSTPSEKPPAGERSGQSSSDLPPGHPPVSQ